MLANNKSGVFSDINLRKVAAAAVDREQIVNTVYENHADIAQGLLGPALARSVKVPTKR